MYKLVKLSIKRIPRQHRQCASIRCRILSLFFDYHTSSARSDPLAMLRILILSSSLYLLHDILPRFPTIYYILLIHECFLLLHCEIHHTTHSELTPSITMTRIGRRARPSCDVACEPCAIVKRITF